MGFPVVMLVRFWENHHLLDLVQRPVWRVVAHRSRQYVRKIVQGAVLSACGVQALCLLALRFHS